MTLSARVACVLIWCAAAVCHAEETKRTVLDFKDLTGWQQDAGKDEALAAFRVTCPDMDSLDWQAICALAHTDVEPGTFFELFFRPVLIEDGKRALFTGYFEPELEGSLSPTPRYRFPLYRMPPEARDTGLWYSRRQIEGSGVMAGRGLEIAWVDDATELFFLHIQGSGRIRLPNGKTIRVGYSGKNGHDYRSVGAELVRRGVFEPSEVSAQVIGNWVRRNPELGQELLWHNPSFVFFRRIQNLSSELGPLGAMNRPITAGRTIAVDPVYVTLGSPVWIEKEGHGPIRRLMIAQDTGSAIKGAQRADIFVGTGDQAGRIAGRYRDPGRVIVLVPIQQAYAMATEPDF
ncbi:MAG: MltA domain-containing protein [Pseudomonadota bacterium]